MFLFDISKMEKDLIKLEAETAKTDFWNDIENTKKVLAKIKKIKNKYTKYIEIEKELNNLIELTEMIKLEFDEELANEILSNTKKQQNALEKLELETLLSGKYDSNTAIITIHPGAGGTESQDWAEMLYRMYTRWATKNEYEVKDLDY